MKLSCQACGKVIRKIPASARGKSIRCACGGTFGIGRAPRNHAKPLPHGPGTELRKIFESLGIDKLPGCDCAALEREMNALGVEGCKRERERIIKKLEAHAAKYSWWDKLKAGAAAVVTGAALQISVTAPLASCFDLAVERAEQMESERCTEVTT